MEKNPQPLTPADIEKIAGLARIELSKDELAAMTTDVSAILGFVETIGQAETDEVSPISQVTGLSDVWREDVVKRSKISRERMLGNAPSQQDGYIKVKKVL